MTNMEAQKRFSEAVLTSGLVFVDKLNEQANCNSYELFCDYIDGGIHVYERKIKEYEDVFRQLKEKLRHVIDGIKSDDNYDVLNGIRREFMVQSYTNRIVVGAIASKSLSVEAGKTLDNILQIYDEHGVEGLDTYVDLLNNPQTVTNYLGNSRTQIVAMKFLLFRTGYQSGQKIKRNLTGKKILEKLESSYDTILADITGDKKEYSDFLYRKRGEFDTWFNSVSDKMEEFFDGAKKRKSELEETYSAKLKVEKPAKYMKEQSKKYKKSFVWWSIGAAALSMIVMWLLSLILSPRIEMSGTIVNLHLFSHDMPIYSSIIIVAMISLVIYVIRIFIKVALSAKHIGEEYEQKHVLTYFYLSLLDDGKINEEVGKYILMSLFDRADTGLIKNDGSSDRFSSMMMEKIFSKS